MADKNRDQAAIRAMRDRLIAELAEIDRLGLRMAGNEINAAIEVLNHHLGEEVSKSEIQKLQKRFFSD